MPLPRTSSHCTGVENEKVDEVLTTAAIAESTGSKYTAEVEWTSVDITAGPRAGRDLPQVLCTWDAYQVCFLGCSWGCE